MALNTEVRQYGLPANGETPCFPVVKDEVNKDGFRVETRRVSLPLVPEGLASPDFSKASLKVLNHRYLLEKENEQKETPQELLWRVAYGIAAADGSYGGDISKSAREFYSIMASREFLPNSPTLMNAGTEMNQLSACFVIPIEDDMESILRAFYQTAWIHKTGGGTGFDFSKLRPKDSPLSSGGKASGPISFMERFFDSMTEAIKQGGKRRGANMAILKVTHPDIREFITIKSKEGRLSNFNISVAVDKKFMEAALAGEIYQLINPHTGETREEKAKEILDLIVENAHAHADPGIVFLDRINEDNPTPALGRIEATNPCGEQPLLPHESCNLGSINLAEMTKEGEVDWQRLEKVTKTAVHFLDNVIDINRLPSSEIEEATKKTRKIGLGIMGFADMLFKLGVKYDSEETLEIGKEVMGFITDSGHQTSEELAQIRGCFPAYPGSIYEEQGILMRNATVTTIAPTGSISMIAGCSSGIEPLFQLVSFREDDVVPEGRWTYSAPFEILVRDFDLTQEEIEQIKNDNSLEAIERIPDEVKELVRIAHDVSPEWHVRIQAALQTKVDSAVSKTINLPHQATVEDVRQAYLQAWREGCKGITVYRDRSKETQVLYSQERRKPAETQVLPRPEKIAGDTHRIRTPVGTAFITVNFNGEDRKRPFELFISVGKTGSDVAADAEMAGRMISLFWRSHPKASPEWLLKEVIGQLENIGGANSIGFGSQRVRSLADGVAKVLKSYLVQEEENPGQKEERMGENKPREKKTIGDLCPECGAAKLVRSGGCPTCLDCGYSVC